MAREEFFALTLRQWDALHKRREEAFDRRDRMTELMGAQIVAMVRRCGFINWPEVLTAEDFMPSMQREKMRAEKKKTRKQRLAEDWAKYAAAKEVYLARSRAAGLG